MTTIREAAQGVVDRWDTPLWKDVPATAHYIAALREALAQDQFASSGKEINQDPVAWMFVNTDGECEQIEYGELFDDPGVTPLYTAPPQREWQGLTDDEVAEVISGNFSERNYWVKISRAIEQALKEKNT